MKCKATVRSIMKARPCYSSTQIKSLFRKLKVKVITPKMVANLNLGNRVKMDRAVGQCGCSYCMKACIRTDDRLWGLLNCFGLKAQSIRRFMFPAILQLLKKFWPDAPDLVIQYLKTGRGKVVQAGDELIAIADVTTLTSDQRFLSGLVHRLITGNAEDVHHSAYVILKMCADYRIHSVAWYVKKLAEVCESQI